MTFAAAITFAFAIFILAITPGPAVFAISARAINSGTKAALGVIFGIAIANVIWFTLALTGMASLSQKLGSAFIIVKLAGGAYLIWLGIKMWRQKPVLDASTQNRSKHGFFKNTLEGLAISLTNPKAAIFYAALLPTFVDLSAITLIDSFILIAIIVIIGGAGDLCYMALATRARKHMKNPKVQKAANRIAGTTLIGVGVTVATR